MTTDVELQGLASNTNYDEQEDMVAEERPKKQRKQRKLILIISCIIFSVLIVISLLSVTIPLSIYYSGVSPPSYFSWDDITNTIEFQIDLHPREDWSEDREKMVAIWIATINHYTDLFTIKRHQAIEDPYMQYHIIGTKEKRCSLTQDTKIRYRSYSSGETVIDVKGTEHGFGRYCAEPYWPAEKYYSASKQKCEEDFHPCFYKHTRGTSVAFDDPKKTFPFCESLSDVFLYAFPTITEENSKNKLSASAKQYWWKLQWKLSLEHNMECDISFTVQYETEHDAKSRSGTVVSGEWSMRVFSVTNEDWDEDILASLEDMYYHLILEFNQDDTEHTECALEH
eukprot:CAMPEP_0206204276 /NCGR_PEP_ID=MMETSP0166-20121206/13401_1 /ASSEMBLY_ACC=CAM_ASM_000260 /TAXON_ID=95228 /ORGANISM="Vannella robusta, Strain DIVA3 518/3/11/1/6" /LENGTH=339 /DNA_ID=CAMNT_0053623819 /DNA_START=672 /DNA_END=1688 /DNA_ORIENTATION=+